MLPVDNSRLVFSRGNQWGKEKDAGPFFGTPAAWRRFIFQVLNVREFAVYTYVCAVMDPNAIAYPTPEQIAEDMDVRTRSVIVDALSEIVEKGFLLAGADPRPGRMGKRTVYQRPLPHHTIKVLLENDLIDADLFPVGNPLRNEELTRASDDVVRASLKAMLGEQIYRGYAVLKDPARKKKVLLTSLTEYVNEKIRVANEELAVKLAERELKQIIGEIPDFLRDAIAEEQPKAAAGIKAPF